MLQHIDGNAHVPIAFRRTVSTLNIRLKPDIETNTPQNILKLMLLFITSFNGVGIGFNHLSIFSNPAPELIVVKTTLVSVPGGVINILNVNEYTDFFHSDYLI